MLIADLDAGGAGKSTSGVEYKIASNREERSAAFQLVYQSYLQAGLSLPNPFGMRVTPFHLLPTTEVFIAVHQGEVIFTISLVGDGALTLPMESVYRREVQTRREQGLCLGEVSCLADRRSQFNGFFPVFLRLSRLLAQYARKQGLDQLLVAVHPRHARFYRRCLDFRPIGEQRSYAALPNQPPAVALCLDFAQVNRERPEIYNTFFGHALPDELLQPQPITAAECDYFRQMVDPSFGLAPIGVADSFLRGSYAEPAVNVA